MSNQINHDHEKSINDCMNTVSILRVTVYPVRFVVNVTVFDHIDFIGDVAFCVDVIIL